MAKHRSDEASSSSGYTGKHRTSERDMERDTAAIRVDRDDRGQVTGWAVGRDPGPDNYTGR